MNKCKKKTYIIFIVAPVIIFISVLFSGIIGSAELSSEMVLDVLKFKIFGIESPEITNSAIFIVWNLRLPRSLMALTIGGALAVAGAAMQSLTQNVMADPFVLGVSSGALAMVSIGFFIGGTLLQYSWFIPVLAFTGAIFSLILVYLIARGSFSGSSNKLILTGMAVAVTLNAVAQYFIIASYDTRRAMGIIAWMMGSLASVRWNNMGITFFGCLVASSIFIFFARAFDLIALGESTAISLGTNVATIKKIAIVIISIIAGLSVASGGLIGFVGLLIPHIIRTLIGSDYRRLFIVSFIVGGIFLLWMDILARTLFAPQEVPIGIFTAICGGPVFIWLLKRTQKSETKG
ncbi:MAG: iron ABC transporter permease [Clostridiales bacterium]|nr:iron ABC transporter permease [Clostridiales bacterium]